MCTVERVCWSVKLSLLSSPLLSSPLVIAQRLVKLVGTPALLYSGSFLRSYVPRLQAAVFNTLLGTKDAQLRDINSDVLTGVSDGLRRLLCRVMSGSETSHVIEDAALTMALKMFRCPLLQQRIKGLKVIADAAQCARLKSDVNSSLSSDRMKVGWMLTFAPPECTPYTTRIVTQYSVLGFACAGLDDRERRACDAV